MGHYDKRTFLAFSKEVPVEGQDYRCLRMDNENGQVTFKTAEIFLIKSVQEIGKDTYRAESMNSIYIVQII